MDARGNAETPRSVQKKEGKIVEFPVNVPKDYQDYLDAQNASHLWMSTETKRVRRRQG